MYQGRSHYIFLHKGFKKYSVCWNSGFGPPSQGQFKEKPGFIILIYSYIFFLNHDNVPAAHEISILLKQKYSGSLQGHFKVKISCITRVNDVLINLLNIVTESNFLFNLFLNTLTLGIAHLLITLRVETSQSPSKTGTWSTDIKPFISKGSEFA